MVSLLAPYAAYLPAKRPGVSGILEAVALGLNLGRPLPRIGSVDSRLQAEVVWATVGFALTGLIFLLIGLELPVITAGARRSQSRSDLSLQSRARQPG